MGDEGVVRALPVLAPAVGAEAPLTVLGAGELRPARGGVVERTAAVAGDAGHVVDPPRLGERSAGAVVHGPVVGCVAHVGARGGTEVDEVELRDVPRGVARVARVGEVSLVHRVEDLGPGHAAVGGSPNPVAEDRRVHTRVVVRVELDARDAAGEEVVAGRGGVGSGGVRVARSPSRAKDRPPFVDL